MTTMYQCDLSHGNTRTRAYIEARGAKVGARVRLTDTEDDTQYWRVDSVSDKGIDKQYLDELKVAYRGQRKASDI